MKAMCACCGGTFRVRRDEDGCWRYDVCRSCAEDGPVGEEEYEPTITARVKSVMSVAVY